MIFCDNPRFSPNGDPRSSFTAIEEDGLMVVPLWKKI